jgi:restriction system protein
MTSKQKKDLFGIINGLGIIIGLYLCYKLSLGIISFFITLILPSIIAGLIVSIIPIKNTKKKTTYKKVNHTPNRKRVNKNLSDIEILKADLLTLNGTDFERLCFMFFEDKGFKPESTPKTGDHGVDLVVYDPKDGLKIAVQCKRWKNTVGNSDLIKLYGGKRAYQCIGTLFITTSAYTNKAMEYADAVRMDLWNGLVVKDKIGNWQKEKLKKIS